MYTKLQMVVQKSIGMWGNKQSTLFRVLFIQINVLHLAIKHYIVLLNYNKIPINDITLCDFNVTKLEVLIVIPLQGTEERCIT